MKIILDTYLEYKDWINLIKDVVFLFGGYYLIKYLINKNFTEKSKAIKENLKFREDLEEHLKEYVIEKHKNQVGIEVRFVHWKNYPSDLDNDGFKHTLFTYSPAGNILPSGYIDNTGINIEEPIWRYSRSAYVDGNGIFFFDSVDNDYKGFREYKNTVLVYHLSYKNIVNYDFREFIEYEPVFYITYPYTNVKKLYDDKVELRNKADEEFLMISLNQKKMMREYSVIKYQYLKFKT